MPIVTMNLKCEFSPMVAIAIAKTVGLARDCPRLSTLLAPPLTEKTTKPRKKKNACVPSRSVCAVQNYGCTIIEIIR